MFAADKRFLQRFGAQTLFLVGALGCVVRWVLLGSSTDLAVLVLGQLLHGVTFCVSHLGAIRFMTRQLPAEQQIPTQALYAALGLGMTVAALMAICGVLFEPLGEASSLSWCWSCCRSSCCGCVKRALNRADDTGLPVSGAAGLRLIWTREVERCTKDGC